MALDSLMNSPRISKVDHSVFSGWQMPAVMNGALTAIVIDPYGELEVSQVDFEDHNSLVRAVLDNLDPELGLKTVLAVLDFLLSGHFLDQLVDLCLAQC